MIEHEPTLPKSLRGMALTFATFGSYKAEQRLRDAADAIEQLEAENAELRELMKHALINLSAWMGYGHPEWMVEKARELGIEVDE